MESSVKCFPTYVRDLPNGSEEGKFLSLDLGGTNFRVIVMELTKDKEFLMDNKIYAIPRSIMEGNITHRAMFKLGGKKLFVLCLLVKNVSAVYSADRCDFPMLNSSCYWISSGPHGS